MDRLIALITGLARRAHWRAEDPITRFARLIALASAGVLVIVGALTSNVMMAGMGLAALRWAARTS